MFFLSILFVHHSFALDCIKFTEPRYKKNQLFQAQLNGVRFPEVKSPLQTLAVLRGAVGRYAAANFFEANGNMNSGPKGGFLPSTRPFQIVRGDLEGVFDALSFPRSYRLEAGKTRAWLHGELEGVRANRGQGLSHFRAGKGTRKSIPHLQLDFYYQGRFTDSLARPEFNTRFSIQIPRAVQYVREAYHNLYRFVEVTELNTAGVPVSRVIQIFNSGRLLSESPPMDLTRVGNEKGIWTSRSVADLQRERNISHLDVPESLNWHAMGLRLRHEFEIHGNENGGSVFLDLTFPLTTINGKFGWKFIRIPEFKGARDFMNFEAPVFPSELGIAVGKPELGFSFELSKLTKEMTLGFMRDLLRVYPELETVSY